MIVSTFFKKLLAIADDSSLTSYKLTNIDIAPKLMKHERKKIRKIERT
jgi:hypothetical protein